MAGPLTGVRVIEVAGLGPAPFGAMVLADYGADVITVDRADRATGAPIEAARSNTYGRGRRSIAIDLKSAEGVEVVRRLTDAADVFVEGFRPGVAERLGIGPDDLCRRNPRLIYGRMTGWGQDGPMAARAGHDINYVAMAGPLAHIGRAGQPPTPPLNLVGDFGGGGLLLALGVCAALVERSVSGRGQVIDAAMVDGAALLSAPMVQAYLSGYLHEERGTNFIDSGAPYYDAYETADGRWLSVGAIEPQFYAALLEGLGLAGDDLPDQDDQAHWPEMKDLFAAVVKGRSLDEWLGVFEGVDACVGPVRTYREALDDPHLRARGTYLDRDGVAEPAPAPRFSRTPARVERPPAPAGFHTVEVLTEAGFEPDAIERLKAAGAVA